MFFKLKSKTKEKQRREYKMRMTSYKRIQFWLNTNIAGFSSSDPEQLHERLVSTIESQKERLKQDGVDPKICKGLERYIKNNYYRKMLEYSD